MEKAGQRPTKELTKELKTARESFQANLALYNQRALMAAIRAKPVFEVVKYIDGAWPRGNATFCLSHNGGKRTLFPCF